MLIKHLTYFLDVFEALLYHFQNNLDIIIWFDLFSNNQHHTSELNFEWWSHTFQAAIREIGYTVMVLAPWNNPVPLTRAWCLWELYCTAVTQVKYSIAKTQTATNQFLEDIVCKDTTEEMNKMFAMINVRKSKCFKSEDRIRIFQAIESSVGFNRLNTIVFEKIRDWVIEVMEIQLQQSTQSTSTVIDSSTSDQNFMTQDFHLRIMMALAVLYKNQGVYEKAEPLYVNCLRQRKQLLGEDHPDTLWSLNGLGSLYKKEGKYHEAEPLYLECYQRRQVVLGAGHADTLWSQNNLAMLYSLLSRYEEAEILFEQCFDQYRESLGPIHASTLSCMNGLATVYEKRGKLEKAETLLLQCLEKRKEVSGEYHPYTFWLIYNIAILYHKKKDFKQAELFYLDCYEKRKIVLGETHPETLLSIHGLATFYQEIEAAQDKAKKYFEECITKRRSILGDSHPDTLKSIEKYQQFLHRSFTTENISTIINEIEDNNNNDLESTLVDDKR
jgi:tetratricopeptide (TPR) repeat protein